MSSDKPAFYSFPPRSISSTLGLKLLHFGKPCGGFGISWTSPTCSTRPMPTAKCHSDKVEEEVLGAIFFWSRFAYRSGSAAAKSPGCRLWSGISWSRWTESRLCLSSDADVRANIRIWTCAAQAVLQLLWELSANCLPSGPSPWHKDLFREDGTGGSVRWYLKDLHSRTEVAVTKQLTRVFVGHY